MLENLNNLAANINIFLKKKHKGEGKGVQRFIHPALLVLNGLHENQGPMAMKEFITQNIAQQGLHKAIRMLEDWGFVKRSKIPKKEYSSKNGPTDARRSDFGRSRVQVELTKEGLEFCEYSISSKSDLKDDLPTSAVKKCKGLTMEEFDKQQEQQR